MAPEVNSAIERFVQPDYTGENRCLPCTIVNVGIAALVSLAGAILYPALGAIVFVLAIATIWLRGYVIPGTPALTKRYVPDWILERLGHEPVTHVDDVDLETYLTEIGVVVDDPAADDVTLHSAFESRWQEHIDDLGETTAGRDALAAFVDVPAGQLELRWHDTAFVAHLDDEWIGQWESRSAFVADMAASRAVAEWAPEWESVPLAQRSEILGALRLFLERCPTCEGAVRFEQEAVESCCRQYDVIAATCSGCNDRLFEASV